MHPSFIARGQAATVPITFVTPATWPSIRDGLDSRAKAFADAAGFESKAGRHVFIPAADGSLAQIMFALEAADDPQKDLFRPGRLAEFLPPGDYSFANSVYDARLAALAFALGQYQFTRYRKAEARALRLELPGNVDGDDLSRVVEGVFLARDLINTPTNDMGPQHLEQAAREMAQRHGAAIHSIVGDALLEQNYPLIHAVGRAAAPDRAPRLIDMTWGDANAPKITLVGKGVCFDTGGLDLKPSSGMLNMKKDMGGGATMLALAHMIMSRGLNVRLRLLIAAVENSVSGNSFRPRDIYHSRKGVTVEIGNTDAEGRLVLADALALGAEEQPELIADMATLTGAARVALGPELAAMFTDDDGLAGDMARHGGAEADPVWRLPLWRPYEHMLESKISDTNNVSSGPFAGAITAALFMRRFAEGAKAWLHLDIFAWNAAAKPGRPEGAECQAARALYALLCERYG